MDINQHVTNRLRLNISTESLLGITGQPPESCPFNDPVISSLNTCASNIREMMDSFKEGSSNRWITIEYDEENLEALSECVEQMHYWHDDIIDQLHQVCALEGIDIDDTDLNDTMLEYNTVFEKTVSAMPEHIFNEGVTKLKQGMDDAESAFYHESRIIDAYNELSLVKTALDAFERDEDEPDPNEDEAAYDHYHDNLASLKDEVDAAENIFNNLISEMEHDAESAIDHIEEVVALFDQTLRRQMELYRHATKELKNNLKNLLPE
jgi:tetratricopeptide (TPR) repeat protein